MKSFKDTIIELTREYVSESGMVACEFSVRKELIDNSSNFIMSQSRLLQGLNARWVAVDSSTCPDQSDGDDLMVHMMIVTAPVSGHYFDSWASTTNRSDPYESFMDDPLNW